MNVYIDYWSAPKALYEYTVGTATTSAGGTSVVSTGASFSTCVANKDYFRIDADTFNGISTWRQISSVVGATSLVLATTYPTLVSNGAYTVSNIIDLPDNGVSALVYLTAAEMFMVDGNEKMSSYYQNKGMGALNALKASYVTETDKYSLTNAYAVNREFE
jgi:hypothetical protein